MRPPGLRWGRVSCSVSPGASVLSGESFGYIMKLKPYVIHLYVPQNQRGTQEVLQNMLATDLAKFTFQMRNMQLVSKWWLRVARNNY